MAHETIVSRSGKFEFEVPTAALHEMFMTLIIEDRKFDRIYGGASYRDDKDPRKRVYKLLKESGVETICEERRAYGDDAQSGVLAEVCCDEKTYSQYAVQSAVSATLEDCWSQVCNNEIAVDDRVRALQECLLVDNPRAAGVIVDELCKNDVSDEWRDALVYAAENVHFKEAAQQTRLRSRLRELALELREASQAGAEHVVWSAMRRFSSLIPPEEVDDLLEFLDRKGIVDTRMVALQCVAHVFYASPPSDNQSHDALSRRVEEYAHKFLDPDVFAGGESSSIARNAVLALAALGSSSLEDCLRRVDALGRRWLSRRVRQQLAELLHGWESHNLESKGSSAFKVVQSALSTIQTS